MCFDYISSANNGIQSRRQFERKQRKRTPKVRIANANKINTNATQNVERSANKLKYSLKSASCNSYLPLPRICTQPIATKQQEICSREKLKLDHYRKIVSLTLIHLNEHLVYSLSTLAVLNSLIPTPHNKLVLHFPHPVCTLIQ